MRKTHYIPVTADVPGAASDANCALIRRTIRTALSAEGVTLPCEVDVLLTDDDGIHQINRDMRQVDRPTDVLSFPEFGLVPGQHPGPGTRIPARGSSPWGTWCCPWSGCRPRPRNLATLSGGSWPIW